MKYSVTNDYKSFVEYHDRLEAVAIADMFQGVVLITFCSETLVIYSSNN